MAGQIYHKFSTLFCPLCEAKKAKGGATLLNHFGRPSKSVVAIMEQGIFSKSTVSLGVNKKEAAPRMSKKHF